MIYQWSPCASGAAYTLAIDWQNDGSFTETGDDVTENVLAQGITVEYGRDQDRQLSPSAVGRSGFILCNESRDYSPENVFSPIYSDLGAARPVKFTAEFQGTTYGLFRGRLDDYEIRADRSERSVSFTALDGLSLLQTARLSTNLYSAQRTGEVINIILDEIGWTDPRDIDPGATIVPWWWAESNAFDAVQEIVLSEGPPAIAYVDPDGTFVFKDRHHRIIDTVSLVSQATFAAGRGLCDSPPVTGFSYTAPFQYQHGSRDVINSVSFSVDQRMPDGQLSVVWESDETYTIEDGETITVIADMQNPVMDVQPIDATFTGSGGLTTVVERTSGQSIPVHLSASGGQVVITHLTLTARDVPVIRTVKVMDEDSTSISQHGLREYPNQAPWAGVEDAKAIASIILAHYAQRRPTVQIRVVAQDPDHLKQIFGRRISDRITIRNDELGMNADFHIESVSHTIQRINPDKGPIHAVIFGCEREITAQSSNPFTFDKAGAGFDDGYFGVSGLDDPGSVFIFDHPIQGQFDVGVFGT